MSGVGDKGGVLRPELLSGEFLEHYTIIKTAHLL